MIKVGINGFGRIGRLFLRRCYELDSFKKEFDVVAINDLMENKLAGYLLKYDSVHSIFNKDIQADEQGITVDGTRYRVFCEKDPTKLPWKDLGVDIVVECTGVFRTKEGAMLHVKAGAKKVVISAPAKGKAGADITIVMGVNEDKYDHGKDHFISNASCTTNCLAPIAMILNNEFGIEHGLMTTIHSYTNDQKILDLPHKDYRRARAANLSMIPTTTGAAKAVGLVLPALQGKLDGMAIRVPTPNVSIVDLTCRTAKEISVETLNSTVKEYAEGRLGEGRLKDYLFYLEEPLVTVDLNHNPYSCIFDSLLTKVIDQKLVKCIAWYDNEYGYACRMVDLVLYIAKKF